MAGIGEVGPWTVLRHAANPSVVAGLVVSVGLAIIVACLTALSPLALRDLIDHLTQDASRSTWAVLLLVYLGLQAASRLVVQSQAFLFACTEQAFQLRLSAATFDRMVRLPMRTHVERQAGGLLHLHAMALQGVRLVITAACFTLFPALVQMTLILSVVGALFDLRVWLIVAASMTGYAIIFAWGVRRVADPMRAALASQIQAGALFADGLSNVEAVKGLTAENRLGAMFRQLGQSTGGHWRRVHRRRLETGLLVSVVYVAGMAMVLAIGASGMQTNTVSAGDFVLLHAYMLQLAGPMESTGAAVRDVSQGVSHLAAWGELMRLPVEQLSSTHGRRPTSAEIASPPEVRFEDVSFAYERGRPILDGVSFTASAGRITALVGPSGSGKTSLLHLLLKHDVPSGGRIRIDDVHLGEMDAGDVRLRISVVSQNVVLFNDTLRNNLLLANPDACEAALAGAIAAAGLAQTAADLPLGLDTRVGERGLRLSGGQRQRLALARALLRKTPLLILDEATSALDVETEQHVLASLIASSPGRTTLLVTHRLALAAQADHIVVLEDGRVAEQGSHADLIRMNGVYARLHRMTGGHAHSTTDI